MDCASLTLETEHVVCDLCGADDARPVLNGVDWEFGLPGPFPLVECRGCGLIYQNPRPSVASLALIYPPDYGFYQADSAGQKPPSVLARSLGSARKVAGRIKRLARQGLHGRRQPLLRYPYLDAVPPGAILDIGCATGHTVYPYGQQGSIKQLRDRGWQTHGVEYDQQAVQAGRAAGLDIVQGTITDYVSPPARFDVVRFNHSLEHTISPTADLAAAANLLKPGGRLIVSGPNIASGGFALFGVYWSGLDLPRHFYHFTPATLSKYCGQAGLTVESIHFDGYAEDLTHSLKHFLQSGQAGLPAATCQQQNAIDKLFPSSDRAALSVFVQNLNALFNAQALSDSFTLIALKGAVPADQ